MCNGLLASKDTVFLDLCKSTIFRKKGVSDECCSVGIWVWMFLGNLSLTLSFFHLTCLYVCPCFYFTLRIVEEILELPLSHFLFYLLRYGFSFSLCVLRFLLPAPVVACTGNAGTGARYEMRTRFFSGRTLISQPIFGIISFEVSVFVSLRESWDCRVISTVCH